MTKIQQQKAKRFHLVCPVRTMQQLLRISGKTVIYRLCKHLNVNFGKGDQSRTFHLIMKNIENKMRRLPEYKLRFNKGFEAKRKKKNASFKKKQDELLEKKLENNEIPQQLEPFSYEHLTNTRKRELYNNLVNLLD